jgi:hypothetical protein
VKSLGSVQFSQIGKSGIEWATLLGVTPAAVSRWKSGINTPTPEIRKQIHSLGGPEPKAWDQIVGTKKPGKKPKKRKPVKATPATVAAEADAWLTEVRAFRDELPTLVSDAPGRARLLADAARTLKVLGQMVGIGMTVSTRQILDSPNWAIIESKLLEALTPWPDALRALARALDDTRDP